MEAPTTSDEASDVLSGQRRGWVRIVGSLLVVGLLAACSDDEPPESTTPRVTVDEGSSLPDFVLAEQSVASVPGFGDVVAQPLNDTEVFENPDPRGPCGGESPAPPLEGTAGAVFAAPTLSIVQVVAEGPEVDEYVEAQLADIEEPCGPYQSTTNVETAQQVDEIEVVALPNKRGYFLTARIVTTGQTVFTGSGLVRNDDGVTSLVFGVSAEPIPLQSMESLVRLIDAQLNNG